MTTLLGAAQDLSNLMTELAEARVNHPQNDLTTALVTAEVDGEGLTPAEMAFFFVLLVVAGNETTHNAISQALLALTQHPEQMAAWKADFETMAPTAVEEIVRWATPVVHFRRTVTQDGARIGDQEFTTGDKVVLWYASANRDERVSRPLRLRSPEVAERPPRLRRSGAPLLPRRASGTTRDHGDVPRAVPADARRPGGR